MDVDSRCCVTMNLVYTTQRKAATCANSSSITTETVMSCHVGCNRSRIESFSMKFGPQGTCFSSSQTRERVLLFAPYVADALLKEQFSDIRKFLPNVAPPTR